MLLIAVILVTSLSCGEGEINDKKISEIKSDTIKTVTDSKYSGDLTEAQKKVLAGAKEVLKQKADYDMSMAYYTTEYNEEGEYVGGKVFPGGDIDPKIGVCTDVVVRSLREGKVVDLQEELNKDIRNSWSDYPMKRWGAKKPDSNIDHRRVPNLEVWLSKYWAELPATYEHSDYQPGDIVVWDLNQVGTHDHIGIVSDKLVDGRVYIIHNFPNPGYVAEEDVLDEWEVVGHYRIK
jgi:uncharacterized protein YijF (DUF1287 family)